MTRKQIGFVSVALTVIGLLLLVLVAFFNGFNQFQPLMDLQGRNQTHVESVSVVTSHRKLLEHRGGGGSAKVEPNRVWGDKCTKSDIVVNQGSTTPMPNGIPTYTVEIMNVCSNGCEISNIHLSCGWFSSARMINPKVFKRVRFDDCIVNNGNPLVNGGTLSFQYANTFRYPLSVSYVKC